MLWLLAATTVGAAAAAGVTPEAAIGWKLFHDPDLSRPRNTSCATCHDPAKGFTDGLPLATGAYGDTLPRHTPSVLNLGEARHFFWDGRASSLEEQAMVPLTDPIEMDMTAPEIVERVRARVQYRRAFEAIGVEEITIGAIVGAIAAFERTLVTGPTPFDRRLGGDMQALDPAQERGRMIFFTRGQCATCHLGPNLTDGDFHNTGTGTAGDPGRSGVTAEPADQGLFKTPSLRNWKGRAPFMHDGRFAAIGAVLDFYSEAPPAVMGESELDPLDLTERDKADLEAFLNTLNGAEPDLTVHAATWQALLGRDDPEGDGSIPRF